MHRRKFHNLHDLCFWGLPIARILFTYRKYGAYIPFEPSNTFLHWSQTTWVIVCYKICSAADLASVCSPRCQRSGWGIPPCPSVPPQDAKGARRPLGGPGQRRSNRSFWRGHMHTKINLQSMSIGGIENMRVDFGQAQRMELLSIHWLYRSALQILVLIHSNSGNWYPSPWKMATTNLRKSTNTWSTMKIL